MQGFLNTKVFLQRYPTTPTNRNRARSRWTHYHFLGIDIEKSASRTTDPVALADTNNPTMHNAACTVCHTVMDPVAGAYQNYGNKGLYRDQYGGMDSLDRFYKAYRGVERAVTGEDQENRSTLSWVLRLAAGENDVSVDYTNDFYDEDTGEDGYLYLDTLRIVDEGGETVGSFEFEDIGSPIASWGPCGEARSDHLFLWNGGFPECTIWLDVDVPATGNYRIDVVAWADPYPQFDGGLARMAVAVDPYREGDTWYRDMRAPGLAGKRVPTADNSLQWLAGEIVADARFAEATVRFWWPAIMGADIVDPPANEEDAGFDGVLLASSAQSAEVERLARGFRRGFRGRSAFNLKDLLVEMILSRWFRAESLADGDPTRSVALSHAGARRLLTPEELATKTQALTGFQWGRYLRGSRPWFGPGEDGTNALAHADEYRLLYGGIDSDGVTDRARDLTSVMAGVAQSHAVESSCPIALKDFYLVPEEDRRLFGGVDVNVSPITEFFETFDIAAESRGDKETVTVGGSLSAGPATVKLSFGNDHYGDDGADRNLRLDRLDIRDRDGGLVSSQELERLGPADDCNYAVGDHFALHCTGSVEVATEIPVDGIYDIDVVVWADQAGEDLAKLTVHVGTEVDRSAGSRAVKRKLVELFDRLLGIRVSTASPEVLGAYDLFIDVWSGKRGLAEANWPYVWEDGVDCHWGSDEEYFEDVVDDAFVYREDWGDEWGARYNWDWERINAHFETIDWSDRDGVVRTWMVVLAYLMMDYRYLYL